MISEQDREFVISQYKSGLSIFKIQRVIHKTGSTISKILRDAGIETCKRYEKDELFFEQINTFEKAYCLGRLYADGHIRIRHKKNSKSTSYNFGLTTSGKDKEDLIKFLKCFGSDYKIDERLRPPSPKGGKKWTIQCTIDFYSKKMVEDLIKLGCDIGGKGEKIRFPTVGIVSEEFLPAFTLGYFDGDGSTSDKYKNSTPFVILGNKEFCVGMMEWLSSKLGLPKANVRPKKSIWCFNYGGRLQLRKIRDLLYKNATIWMSRKRKIFDDFLDAPRRKYQHLFDFEEQKIIEEYQSGKKCVDICIGNNINRTRLFKLIKRYGIQLRHATLS
jgi:hypothetical protein